MVELLASPACPRRLELAEAEEAIDETLPKPFGGRDWRGEAMSRNGSRGNTTIYKAVVSQREISAASSQSSAS
jgi:hypothetical protein